jgi:hypothetical protein
MVVYCDNCGEFSSWYQPSHIKPEDKICEKCNEGRLKRAIYDSSQQMYVRGAIIKKSIQPEKSKQNF